MPSPYTPKKDGLYHDPSTGHAQKEHRTDNKHLKRMNNQQEQWRDIEGYEGRYQVSNMGRIRAMFPYRGISAPRILSVSVDKRRNRGHKYVLLKKDKKTTNCNVGQLVAKAFVDGYQNGYEISYKDGNVLNICAENLEWKPAEGIMDLEGEIWRDVVGYESFYQVSNLGRIKSLGNTGGDRHRIMAPVFCHGYVGVVLKGKHHRLHRLVARAFVGGYRKGMVVNHKDENKLNNKADNLEWVTPRENALYGTALDRGKESVIKRMGRPVERIDMQGCVTARYRSQSEAAREEGIGLQTLRYYREKGIDGWRYSGGESVKRPVLVEKRGERVKKAVETRNRLGLYGAEKPVMGVSDADGNTVTFKSCAEAARKTGINAAKISQNCRGKRRSAGGYVWQYIYATVSHRPTSTQIDALIAEHTAT